MQKTELIAKLKELFIKKIKEDWQTKWAKNHGNTFVFSELKSQTAFLIELLDDIENSLKQKIGLERTANILISRDSLRRLLGQENQAILHDKTKKTLTYYLGYEGWEDFEAKFTDLANTIPTSELPQSRTSFFRLIPSYKYWILGILLVSVLLYFVPVFKPKLSGAERFKLTRIQNNKEIEYPEIISLSYDLSDLKYEKAEIIIRNEYLQYPGHRVFKLSNKKDTKIIEIFTPGIKVISLFADGKLISNINYMVKTGTNWYGCMRTKSGIIASPPSNTEIRSYWYGEEQTINTEDNWLTTTAFWRNYVGLNKNKAHYDEKYLTFPKVSNPANKNPIINKSYTRVAFVKCDDFPIDMNELSLSFRMKRDKGDIEDCTSMALQLFDADRSQISVHSDYMCNTPNITFEKALMDSTTGQDIRPEMYGLNDELHSIDKLNGILEDFQWHSFKLVVLNGTVTIKIDDVEYCKLKSKIDYKTLKTIRLVFEGNGFVDDVVLSNSITQVVIFSDNFDN